MVNICVAATAKNCMSGRPRFGPCDITPVGQRFFYRTLPEGASIPLVLGSKLDAELKKSRSILSKSACSIRRQLRHPPL